MRKILILSKNPPKTYLNALDKLNIEYDYGIFPVNLKKYCGCLLVGGGDILPAYYGKHIKFHDANFILDKIQLDIIKYFVEKRLSVLGICRGAQLVCVLFGGTLKNVKNHFLDGDTHSIISSGYLSEINRVNSYHCQAVDVLPKIFEIIAVKDEVIEAFSYKNITCCQFHPEKMDDDALFAVYGKFLRDITFYKT